MRNSWRSWLLFLSLSIVPSGCQQVSERVAAWREDRGGKESQVAGDIYEAGRLEREGKLAESRDLYVKVHQKDPENFHAVHRLAVVSTQLKEDKAAQEYFAKALKLNPKDPVLLADMGYALALKEDYPNAERALRLSIKEDPKSERARKSLGRVLAQQGKTEEARDVLREVYPEDQANLRVAGYLIQQKKPEAAEKYLLAAKAATKDDKLLAEIDQQLARKPQAAPGLPVDQQLAAKQPAPAEAAEPVTTAAQKIDIPPALQAELAQVQNPPAQNQPAATQSQQELLQEFPFAEPSGRTPQVAQTQATPAEPTVNPFAELAAKESPAVQKPARENPFAELNQPPASENPFAGIGTVAQLTPPPEPSPATTPAENPFSPTVVQAVAQATPVKPATTGPALIPKHGALKPRASSPFIYPFAESEESLLVRVVAAEPQAVQPAAVPPVVAPAVPAAAVTPAVPAIPVGTLVTAPAQSDNPFAELAQAAVTPAVQPVPPAMEKPAVQPAPVAAPEWESPSPVRTASSSKLIQPEAELPATRTEPAFDQKTPVKLAEDTGTPLELRPPLARPAQNQAADVLPFPVLDFGWRAVEVDGTPQFGEKGWQNYCPVELRENRQLARSSEKFTSTHAGKNYQFSSRKCRDMFNADPERYIAAAGGMDVVKFQQDGVKIDGSLAFARWYQDRLYFFTSQETLDSFVEDPSLYIHLSH